MAIKIATPPAQEPIDLTEAKAHVRIDGADDDALLTALIMAARQAVEEATGRALVTQTWDLWLDDFTKQGLFLDDYVQFDGNGNAYTGGKPLAQSIELPRSPLQSVTAVYYYQDDDVEATLAASNYIVDSASEPGRVALKRSGSWPTSLRPINGARIRFVCGYGTPSAVPQPLKQAMLMLISHWFENRETVNVGTSVNELPFSVQMLLQPYRIMRL